jgi:hypothetical protein
MFMVNDGENLKRAYARLIALKEKICGLGGEIFKDGFVMNDEFIKNKFNSFFPRVPSIGHQCQFLDPLQKMTTKDLTRYFIYHDGMISTTMKTMEIVRAMNNTSSLASKAKVFQGKEIEE